MLKHIKLVIYDFGIACLTVKFTNCDGKRIS